MDLDEKYALLLGFVQRVAQSNTVMSSYAGKTLEEIGEPVVFVSVNGDA